MKTSRLTAASKFLRKQGVSSHLQLVCLVAALLLTTLGSAAQAQHVEGCNPVPGQGAWHQDYRQTNAAGRAAVERRHFTHGVENLTAPSTTTFNTMAADVGYTLNKYPNHHRALMTMIRLGERHRSNKPPGSSQTIDCWLQNAVLYAPDDTVARAIYAKYLHGTGRRELALQQLALTLQHGKDNAMTNFTVGTIYLDMKEYDLALAQAHKARELGDPRDGLEMALRQAGRWADAKP